MNCGYGRGFSVLEVLDASTGSPTSAIERRMEPRRAGDPDALVADNGRILATLPWRPKRDDLDTIVADALAWERALAERPARRARLAGRASGQPELDFAASST